MSASGERLATRLRVQLFRAFLHQTIGWYDDEEHTTGALTTTLTVDADNVKNVSQLLSMPCLQCPYIIN